MPKTKFADSIWPLVIFLGLGVGTLASIAVYCQVINPLRPLPAVRKGHEKPSATSYGREGSWIGVDVESAAK